MNIKEHTEWLTKDAISYFEEQGFQDELTTDKKYYVEALITGIRSKDEQISTLAYENKAMAEHLEKSGYNPESIIFEHREG